MSRNLSLVVSCLIALASLAGCENGAGQPEVVPYVFQDTQVDSGGAATVAEPRMCVDGSTVYAVWQDDRRGRNQVFFRAGRGGGAAWDAELQLSGDPEGTSVAENPAIACAGDSVYVVWEDDRDSDLGHRSIYLRYSDDGGRTWENDQLVTSDPDGDWDALGPVIVVDYDASVSPDRKIAIAWYDNRQGAYDIYFTRSDNGYNFLPQEVRLDTDEPGSAYSAYPVLGTDGFGGIYVAWLDSRWGGNDVYFNHSTDWGYNWSAEDVRLDVGVQGGVAESFGHTLTVDQHSLQPAIYVAWHDDRNGGKDIFVNSSLDAGWSWQEEPTRMENDAPGASDAFYPSVTAWGGRVVVAWQDNRNVGNDIYVRGSSNGGQTWGAEVRIDRGGDLGATHSLTPLLDSEGDRVVASYLEHRPIDTAPEGQPDLYLQISEDGGDIWLGDDLRVDDDSPATGISEDQQMVLAGPFVYLLWVDYRSGDADLWFRAMPSAPTE